VSERRSYSNRFVHGPACDRAAPSPAVTVSGRHSRHPGRIPCADYL